MENIDLKPLTLKRLNDTKGRFLFFFLLLLLLLLLRCLYKYTVSCLSDTKSFEDPKSESGYTKLCFLSLSSSRYSETKEPRNTKLHRTLDTR